MTAQRVDCVGDHRISTWNISVPLPWHPSCGGEASYQQLWAFDKGRHEETSFLAQANLIVHQQAQIGEEYALRYRMLLAFYLTGSMCNDQQDICHLPLIRMVYEASALLLGGDVFGKGRRRL